MNEFNKHNLPEDLEQVAERLRQDRPEATPLELDQIKVRAMSRAEAPKMSVMTRLMRTRLVSLILVVGVLMGGAGAMAVSGGVPTLGGSHGGHHGGKKQYCPPKHRHDDDDAATGGHGKHHGKPKKHKRCHQGPKPGHGHHGDDDGDHDGHHGGGGHHFFFWFVKWFAWFFH
jgi:hypothetical protein